MRHHGSGLGAAEMVQCVTFVLESNGSNGISTAVRMQRLQILAPLLVVAGLVSPPAWAMGFGRPTGVTALGQPLNFSIGLRLDEDESVDPACVNAVVTSGDHVLPAHEVRARLEPVGTGGFRIRVVTGMVVDEPVVQVNLRVGCPPRLARAFTVLADPPSVPVRGGEAGAVPEAADLSSSSANPFFAAAGPGSRSGESAPPHVKRQAAARAVAAVPAAAAAPSAPARPRQHAPQGRGGARPVLQLDPVEADAMVDPPLRMATRLSAAPPVGGASASAAEGPLPTLPVALSEPDRLRALELALAQLRDETARKDRSLADLQLRVRAAAASRPDPSLVYALFGLCGLLAAALAWVLWLRRLERRRAGWWAAAAAEVAEQIAPPPDFAEDFGPATGRHAAGAAPWSAPGALPASRAAGPDAAFAPLIQQPTAVPPAPVPAVATAGTPEPPPGRASAEPRRPMSAEELIDLEQQVEFFVVLGQDDAAIDLLMGQVRSTGGVSPLPYLKLLEIYRRRHEQEPYERIRDRFNRRFNAHAPAWDTDLDHGEALEDYPEALACLQAHWETPSKLMDQLDEMLFHRENGRPFAVPAYRELLFLYGIARDLCERESPNGGVDLLLPLGDDDFVARFRSAAAATGMPLVEEPLSLDLDISTGHPDLRAEFGPHSGMDFVVDEDVSSKPR